MVLYRNHFHTPPPPHQKEDADLPPAWWELQKFTKIFRLEIRTPETIKETLTQTNSLPLLLHSYLMSKLILLECH